MSVYLIQRLLGVVVTIFFVAITIFLMVRLLPGDPARVIAGVLASQEEVERMAREIAEKIVDERLAEEGVSRRRPPRKTE